MNDVHHDHGRPLDPKTIRREVARGSASWVYLRLAQDPDRAYLGRVLDIRPPGSGVLAWTIVTRLAHHADDRRCSHLRHGMGVDDGFDEVLALTCIYVESQRTVLDIADLHAWFELDKGVT